MARQRVPDGPAPDPVVQRLRVRYAKRGRLRFASGRDLARAIERGLRRAGVPMAFSAGFHPHPKISYSNPAPTGVASEAEYLELQVTQRVDPGAVRAALDAALPTGLDVVQVVEAGGVGLPDLLQASDWRFEIGLTPEAVRGAVTRLRERDAALVTRMTKSGARTFDVLGAIVSATVSTAPLVGGDALVSGDATVSGDAQRTDVGERLGEGLGDPPGTAACRGPSADCAILRMVVRHTTPAVRPDDILTALREITGLQPPRPPVVTRLAQGPLNTVTARVADPLAAHENADGT